MDARGPHLVCHEAKVSTHIGYFFTQFGTFPSTLSQEGIEWCSCFENAEECVRLAAKIASEIRAAARSERFWWYWQMLTH